MRTFAELLTEYTTRVGISDAELARALGVRRQTIFRWKEGLVARPRNVEDVLRCATKLRLTPEERDLLLVAAGFPPEGMVPAPGHVTQAAGLPPVMGGLPPAMGDLRSEPHLQQSGGLPYRAPSAWLLAALLLLAVAGGLFLIIHWSRGVNYPVAKPGETLIVIGRFVNYAGGQQGYNVAGRLQATLAREVTAGRLTQVRAAVWPEEIPDEGAAQTVARRSGAALVIWGEYDSGRVLTHFTATGARSGPDAHQLEKPLTSPAELAGTINSSLPEEVRYLALLTLGQVYMDRGDFTTARAILIQALTQPPADPIALATLYSTLGYAYHVGQPADLDQAIAFYSQAVALAPETVSVYNNRGIAYLSRGRPGDAERAIADLTAFVAALPESPLAHTNRGLAYLQLGGDENLRRGVADFDRALELAPDAADTCFARGLTYVRLGDSTRWQADLRRVLELTPDHAGAHNALCWAYALDDLPLEALPYCDRAVALDPAGPARDSRGIVYAELGRFDEAIAEFETYLTALRNQGDDAYRRYGPRREGWLTALRAGDNPFDRETLEQLREE